MKRYGFVLAGAVGVSALATAAQAECTGSNGRGWASGKGAGEFTMSASDGACQMGFTSFINDSTKTRIPATTVKLSKAPKNGKISLTSKGPVYTPAAGFRGKDRFCTVNTSADMPGKSLTGCVTVTVN